MSRKIQAHEARIHTATVEVKTLTISGRQVTLSVFRQLPKRELIRTNTVVLEVDLYGEPWGTVNYYFDECKKCAPSEHLHVVWQNDEELCRSCVPSWEYSKWTATAWFRLQNAEVRDCFRESYRDCFFRLQALPQLYIAT